MGYCTDFYLSAEPIDEALHDQITEALEEKRYGFESPDLGFWQKIEDTWRDHEAHIFELSQQFPNVQFRLMGNGESMDDKWVEYFQNGKIQFASIDEIEQPVIPYRWLSAHKVEREEIVYDTQVSDAEKHVDYIHNLLYHCMIAMRARSSDQFVWNKDLLDRALSAMAAFMRREGIPTDMQAADANFGSGSPTTESANRIVIVVDTGMVEDVYAEDRHVSVEILDKDSDDAERLEEIEKAVAELEADVENGRLVSVY